MFSIKEHSHLNNEQFTLAFKEYCKWCWGNDFGDCNICKARYKEELKKRKIPEDY